MHIPPAIGDRCEVSWSVPAVIDVNDRQSRVIRTQMVVIGDAHYGRSGYVEPSVVFVGLWFVVVVFATLGG